MKKTLLSISLLSSLVVFSQEGRVGINTVTPKSTLEVSTTTANTTSDVEGILIPRVSKEKAYLMANATTTPEESTLVYVNDDAYTFPTGATDAQKAKVADITENGYYFWNTTKWVKISGKKGQIWKKLPDNEGVYLDYFDSNDTNDTIKYLSNGRKAYSKDLYKLKSFDPNTGTEHIALADSKYSGVHNLTLVRDTDITPRSQSPNGDRVANSYGIIMDETSPSSSGLNTGLLSSALIWKDATQDKGTVTGLTSNAKHSGTGNVNTLRGILGAALNENTGTVDNLKSIAGYTFSAKNSISKKIMGGDFPVRNESNNNSKYLAGVSSAVNNFGSGDVEFSFGGDFSLRHRGSGDVTKLRGVSSVITTDSNATGTITDAYLFYGYNSIDNATTVTNLYGLHMNNIDQGTNNYAIFTNAGKVSLGDSLQVRNINGTVSTNATDKIVVADVDGVLKTKDATNLITANSEWKYDATTKNIDLARSGTTPFDNKVYYNEQGNYRNIQDNTIETFNTNTSSWEVRDITEPNAGADYLQRNSTDLSSHSFTGWLGATKKSKILSRNLLVVDGDNTATDHTSSTGSIITKKGNSLDYESLAGGSFSGRHQGQGNIKFLTGVSGSARVSSGTIASNGGDGLVGVRASVSSFTSGNVGRMASVRAFSNLSASSGTVGDMQGIYGQTSFRNSSTVASMSSLYLTNSILNGANPTIGEAYGIRYNGFWTETGANSTITDNYGLWLGDIEEGTNNNYAIFTNAGDVSLLGNTGIGQRTPEDKLHITGAFRQNFNYTNSNTPTIFRMATNTGDGNHSLLWNTTDVIDSNSSASTYYAEAPAFKIGYNHAGSAGGLTFLTADSGAAGSDISWKIAIHLAPNSNVGVGTISPAEKLEVAGKVKADSFISTTAGANVFPDYVFEKYYNGESKLNANYNFKSLNEVETFVKAKGHLPGYISAKEIATKGQFNMTEVQLTNVEKIEELYLHTIEQEKKIKAQNSILEKQQKEIQELKSMVKQLLKK